MAHEHMADLLDLDAEVLSEYHREVAEWVSANLTERARVIDVGAGTGTGTLALARQLPDAEVVALDVDEEMLKHIQDKARAGGRADLPDAGPRGTARGHGTGVVPAFSHRPGGRGARGADPHRHGAGS